MMNFSPTHPENIFLFLSGDDGQKLDPFTFTRFVFFCGEISTFLSYINVLVST
jgi:hypothetical protein